MLASFANCVGDYKLWFTLICKRFILKHQYIVINCSQFLMTIPNDSPHQI